MHILLLSFIIQSQQPILKIRNSQWMGIKQSQATNVTIKKICWSEHCKTSAWCLMAARNVQRHEKNPLKLPVCLVLVLLKEPAPFPSPLQATYIHCFLLLIFLMSILLSCRLMLMVKFLLNLTSMGKDHHIELRHVMILEVY